MNLASLIEMKLSRNQNKTTKPEVNNPPIAAQLNQINLNSANELSKLKTFSLINEFSGIDFDLMAAMALYCSPGVSYQNTYFVTT